jgi:hypothetical protein
MLRLFLVVEFLLLKNLMLILTKRLVKSMRPKMPATNVQIEIALDKEKTWQIVSIDGKL